MSTSAGFLAEPGQECHSGACSASEDREGRQERDPLPGGRHEHPHSDGRSHSQGPAGRPYGRGERAQF